MRKTTPVLALSTIVASILFAANQHSADAACTSASAPGCNEPARPIGRVAEMGFRPGPEEQRAREHDLPTDLWDRVRAMAPSQAALEDLNGRIADVIHLYTDAEGKVREATKKIQDADDRIDRAKSEKITAEAEKRAAEEERGREFARFIWLLEDALREFRPPPPPPPREPRWRPHRVFWHHFHGHCEVDPCVPCGCPVERRPEFFPLIGPH
jgi:hypothetical protein